jgi:hypothetical protein
MLGAGRDAQARGAWGGVWVCVLHESPPLDFFVLQLAGFRSMVKTLVRCSGPFGLGSPAKGPQETFAASLEGLSIFAVLS